MALTGVTSNHHSNDLFYTGVGSRDAPQWALDLAFELGVYLARRGFTLRSGGADGMDDAFEWGCMSVGGKCNIYLPWNNFNHRKVDNATYINSLALDKHRAAELIAKKAHPNWDALKASHRILHTRNVFQVLGGDLNTPSAFILLYAVKVNTFTVKGGTNTAFRIGLKNAVPVFNLYNPIHRSILECLVASC